MLNDKGMEIITTMDALILKAGVLAGLKNGDGKIFTQTGKPVFYTHFLIKCLTDLNVF